MVSAGCSSAAGSISDYADRPQYTVDLVVFDLIRNKFAVPRGGSSFEFAAEQSLIEQSRRLLA